MADQKIVAAKITVDTGSANANLKEVNKNLGDVKTSLKDAGSAASKTGKDIEGSTGNFANLKSQLGGLPGPLGKAGGAVEELSSKFKALLANPVVLIITAIVAALALLYKAFTNTFEGAEKVEQVFAGIKAAAQALFDNLSKIGSAIVKFFSFDFSGALADIKGVVNAATDAYSAMAKLTQQAQELHREQLENDLDQAKRAKQLAVLREQATDEDVPLAKRKAALKELQAAAEENAKQDVDLAKRTAQNKIAQLTLEKDGARKNQDEINKIKIEQINVETDNANELRRINKQVTAAEKQELAERKAAATKAAEEAKKRRAELLEFNNKLAKLQQDNELLTIKDAYEKELKQLDIRIANEKKVNAQAYQDKKITRQQQQQLDAALDIQANLQRDAITDKHNEEIKKKEADFQKELAGIRQKTALAAITDTRELERVQLQIGYQEKLNDAIARYKDDAVKLQEVKVALEDQFRQADAARKAKNDAADKKAGFNASDAANNAVINDPKAALDAKKLALDAESQLIQDAFDQRIISETEYTAKQNQLSEARKTIREQEAEHNRAVVSAIGDALETLSEIAGKQTLAGKALAIASTTIKTFQSAIAAFAGVVEQIPGPVGIALGAVAAAGAIASGIAAVKKIVAVQVPGKGGGGGSVPTGIQTPTAPVAPQQQSTKIDQASIKGIGDASSGRAYVLDSDVANNRDRNERLNRAARLGG